MQLVVVRQQEVVAQLIVVQQRKVVVQLIVVLQLQVVGLVIAQQPEVVVQVVVLLLRVGDHLANRSEVLLILPDRRVTLKDRWAVGWELQMVVGLTDQQVVIVQLVIQLPTERDRCSRVQRLVLVLALLVVLVVVVVLQDQG